LIRLNLPSAMCRWCALDGFRLGFVSRNVVPSISTPARFNA
jgi:hypothetical protein